MTAEVEAVVGGLMGLDLTRGAAEVGPLGPVETHLIARHRTEVGRRIYGDFFEAIEGTGTSNPAMICCR